MIGVFRAYNNVAVPSSEPHDKPVLNYSTPPGEPPRTQPDFKKLIALSLMFVGVVLFIGGVLLHRRELWILAIPFVGYGIVIWFGFWFG